MHTSQEAKDVYVHDFQFNSFVRSLRSTLCLDFDVKKNKNYCHHFFLRFPSV
jgi:hypothetical protein